MNRKQFLLTLSVAIISGCLGGALSVWVLMPQSVLAQDEPQKVIEAQEFRVVDEDGTMRIKLAISGDDQSTLSLFDPGGIVRASLVVMSDGRSVLGFSDDVGRGRAYIGMTPEPRVGLSGDSGEALEMRMVPVPTLAVTGDDAMVGLVDAEGNTRISLSLIESEPVLNIIDTQKNYRVWIDERGVSVRDKSNRNRAVLGTTQLTHPNTGSTEIRAPSSLVLFDEDGNVVWKAP